MSEKIKKLRSKRKDLVTRMNKLSDACDAAERDFNETEEKDFNEMEAELKTVDARLEREYRLEGYASKGRAGDSSRAIYENDDGDEEEKAAEEEKEVEDGLAAQSRNRAIYEGSMSVRERAFQKIRSKSGKWTGLGEQLMSVMRASIPGGVIDKRLVEVRDISGANETVPSQGGFLVEPSYTEGLLSLAYENSNLAQYCRRIPLKGNSHKINALAETSRATGSRFGGIQVYWVPEGGTVSPKKPALRQVSLNLHKLMGLCYITEEEMEDATAMESVITEAFPKEMGFVLDDSIVRGSGAGQPLGFLNSPCLVTQAKEASQSAAGLVEQNIFNMRSRMYVGGRPNSRWLINSDVEPQLYPMKLGDLGIYFPGGSFANQPEDRLFGRPVQAIEQASTMGIVGDISLVDLSQYVLAEKAIGGIKASTSVHVRFVYDEMAFKFTYRVDGKPVWDSAITPYKGTATKSAFVTLATRP